MSSPRGAGRFQRLLSIGGIAAAVLLACNAAQAAVDITVDKSAQQMTVAVDGVQRYSWPVSSGVPSHETPNGTFRAFRMEADHYSKEWDDAPMPHAIFFTKVGHAIHGTDSVQRLGTPASHGCVRLSREHAAQLYALVEKEGVLNTTVTLTGSAQIALARGAGRKTQLARSDAGEPMPITPRDDGAASGYAPAPQPGYAAPQPGYAMGYAAPAPAYPTGNDAYAPQQRVTYVDRYGRPLDVIQTPDGRRVYRVRRQIDQADAYAPPPVQPRGFGIFQ